VRGHLTRGWEVKVAIVEQLPKLSLSALNTRKGGNRQTRTKEKKKRTEEAVLERAVHLTWNRQRKSESRPTLLKESARKKGA